MLMVQRLERPFCHFISEQVGSLEFCNLGGEAKFDSEVFGFKRDLVSQFDESIATDGDDSLVCLSGRFGVCINVSCQIEANFYGGID